MGKNIKDHYMFDLKSKTAVITGAGSGIGAATSEMLYKLNANIALISKTNKNVKEVLKRLGDDPGRILNLICDVSDEKALIEARKKILKKWGKIDILVTCAAAAAASSKAEELKFEDWKNLLATDLDGVFLCCKTFGANMLKNKYGRIINLTSFHTVATYPFRIAYVAAKSGVEGLTQALAVEWGKHGITANAVAPGPIKTPRTSWFISQSPKNEDGMLSRTPNARIGEPEDVASLIAFLASEQSRHINGQQIVIDGGWTKSAWWGKYNK
ncbi:MAG: SDR family NAD(P)-dependent oxidoreductase [bacterium]